MQQYSRYIPQGIVVHFHKIHPDAYIAYHGIIKKNITRQMRMKPLSIWGWFSKKDRGSG